MLTRHRRFNISYQPHIRPFHSPFTPLSLPFHSPFTPLYFPNIYVSGCESLSFTLQKTVFCNPKDTLLRPQTYTFQK